MDYRPTVRQLEYLVAAAEHLSFRRGAEACYVTQPGLSAQILQLEERLGLRLFERRGRGVALTPAGRRAVEQARDILSHLDDLVESTRGLGDPLAGELRLGVIPTVAPYLLPQAVPALHRRFEGLRLLLVEERTARLVELAAAGELDLLLLALEADTGGLATLPLFDDPFVLAAPAGHRAGRRKRARAVDLEGEEVLLLGDGHCLGEQTRAVCERAGVRTAGDFRATSLGTLVQMVAGGAGVTLLPSLALHVERRAAPSLELRPFTRPAPARNIGLAWRPSSPHADPFRRLGAVLGEIGRRLVERAGA